MPIEILCNIILVQHFYLCLHGLLGIDTSVAEPRVPGPAALGPAPLLVYMVYTEPTFLKLNFFTKLYESCTAEETEKGLVWRVFM
jgi:hypothetical protein